MVFEAVELVVEAQQVVRAAAQLEQRVGDADAVAVIEPGLVDPAIIDVGAVSRAAIDDEDAALLEGDHGVVTRGRAVGDEDVGGIGAADMVGAVEDIELTLAHSVQHDQARQRGRRLAALRGRSGLRVDSAPGHRTRDARTLRAA